LDGGCTNGELINDVARDLFAVDCFHCGL
jgi:hypothetical protein